MAKDYLDFIRGPKWDELVTEAIPKDTPSEIRTISISALVKCVELSCNEDSDEKIKEKALNLYKGLGNTGKRIINRLPYAYECWIRTANSESPVFTICAVSEKNAAEIYGEERCLTEAIVNVKMPNGLVTRWNVARKSLWWAEPIKDINSQGEK